MTRELTDNILVVSSNRQLADFIDRKLLLHKSWKCRLLEPFSLDICMEVKAADPDVVLFFIDEDPSFTLMSLSRLMLRRPLPVLIVTRDPEMMKGMILKCLEMGAYDVITVPADFESISKEHRGRLMKTVESARHVRIRNITLSQALTSISDKRPQDLRLRRERDRLISELVLRRRYDAIGIAISTGGPHTLSRLLPELPQTMPVPVLIVQHIIKGFIGNIAGRLDTLCSMRVKVASDGEEPRAGVIYLAPDARHMRVAREPEEGSVRIVLSERPRDLLFCPSADVLFGSMAETYGGRCIAAIMTGMGRDGVNGLRALKECGGATMAQDEESSVIFGMARVAIQQQLIERVVPLSKICDVLLKSVFEDKATYSSNEIVSS